VESLLQDVHFFSDDGYSNVWEIVQESEQHGYLLAVSDGSVKFHDMSSGWVLAAPTGKRLAAAAGPCKCQREFITSRRRWNAVSDYVYCIN
jgi:hypothetical protein